MLALKKFSKVRSFSVIVVLRVYEDSGFYKNILSPERLGSTVLTQFSCWLCFHAIISIHGMSLKQYHDVK